jgi:HK97 gp10 family phage protein
MSSVKVTSYVKQAIKGNSDGIDKAMLIMAGKVTAQAKQNINSNDTIDTGKLIGSVMWKGQGKTGGHTKGPFLSYNPRSGYIVGTATEYAVYIEFGTRKMFPKPFLRPAIGVVAKGNSLDSSMKKAITESLKMRVPR